MIMKIEIPKISFYVDETTDAYNYWLEVLFDLYSPDESTTISGKRWYNLKMSDKSIIADIQKTLEDADADIEKCFADYSVSRPECKRITDITKNFVIDASKFKRS